MTRLTLQSEKFAPEGGAHAQGMRRALGKGQLDNISVLVRESIQNSWDARSERSGRAKVAVTIDLSSFSSAELYVLKDEVFKKIPEEHPLKAELRPGMRRLVLSDRGTEGLTGPVFVGDQPLRPTHRFNNLCRIFGRDTTGPVTGGTFGYGKAVYFRASKAATVIVHSRCVYERRIEERLMPISVWNANSRDMTTGRHWWGIPSPYHKRAVGPVTGSEARKLAKQIGLPPFVDDETGTNIMILSPQFGSSLDTDHQLAATCIAEAMTIWFWPRMLGSGDQEGKLTFNVECDGESIAVPDPLKAVPFRIYAHALKNLVAFRDRGNEAQSPNVVKEVSSKKPAVRLGYLSLVLAPRRARGPFAIASREDEEPIIKDHSFADQADESRDEGALCHHVAFVRSPGQVIKYARYKTYPVPEMEYAGIFLVDGSERDDRPPGDVEAAFSAAEPPTHHDWEADEPEDEWHQRYVRIAKRTLSTMVDEFVSLGRPSLVADGQDALGAVSANLGELLSARGTGASMPRKEKQTGTGGGGNGRHGPEISVTGEGQLQHLSGKVVFVLPFRVFNLPQHVLRISANPTILIAGGGTEAEAPSGDKRPRVVGWRRPGKALRQEAELRLKAEEGGEWEVLVEVPTDAMVGVNLTFIDS